MACTKWLQKHLILIINTQRQIITSLKRYLKTYFSLAINYSTL